jgi:hypothetical protein
MCVRLRVRVTGAWAKGRGRGVGRWGRKEGRKQWLLREVFNEGGCKRGPGWRAV